jgi:hypothetical protein
MRKSPTNHFVGLAPQNGNRRTKAEISGLCDRLFEIVHANHPVTVRQCYYLAVSAGVIEKTESAYKNIVCRLLAKMRHDERLPYSWIVDSTRWQRKPTSYAGLGAALERSSRLYRREVWERMGVYVEVWCEKDALSGVLYEITSQWDSPLMVSRGFASHTYLYEAANAIKEAARPAYLYFFGDHDPSGVHIDRAIERELRRHAPKAEIHFERVAVTRSQITKLKLPTRPTKKTDSRSVNFKGRSVEVDAIPPATLKRMVEERIVQHIDQGELRRLRKVEEAERDTLRKLSAISALGNDHIEEFTKGFSYPWESHPADEDD